MTEIPAQVHKKNRERLCAELVKESSQKEVVLLKGGVEVSQYSTDTVYLFRQESYFHWAFGVIEPDCYGAIEIQSKTSYLFVPKPTPSYSIWMGTPPSLAELKEKYDVDEVHYVEDINSVMKSLNPVAILLLSGTNSDSGLQTEPATFLGIDDFHLNYERLFPIISECRVIKTPEEIELIKRANEISSEAHKLIMTQIKPGMLEYQAEAHFKHYCQYHGGARDIAYTCICGSGHNGSILHYGHAAAPNDKRINDGDLCLFDMGCLHKGYASDITCSFPANGKFTPTQNVVYTAVLIARNAVIEALKPGVSWVDMHKLALEKILTHLKENNVLQGEVSDMMEDNLGSTFMPHGLGHFMGCDVHDVGGYLKGEPERPSVFGLKSLRTARALKAGMVLTVEPGCYFINALLDEALASKTSKYINTNELERYRGIGGVRIEDNIVITDTGCINLTQVPRTIEEIEKHMQKN